MSQQRSFFVHAIELASAIEAGDRGLELRVPRRREHLVDLVIRWRSQDAPGGWRRSALGLHRDEVMRLIASLQTIAGVVPAPSSPAEASSQAAPSAPAAPPARPARTDGTRKPGEPPPSWLAAQSAGGSR